MTSQELPSEIPEGLHPALRWLVRQALATLEGRGALTSDEIASHVAGVAERVAAHQASLVAMEPSGVEESFLAAGEHHLAGADLILRALSEGDVALLHEAENELLLGQAHLSVGAERNASLAGTMGLDVQL